ncbi:imidazolonepropionase [Xinfangfangia sp. CPCC 101601]|uniref:Imidazolonepropionase n=1 Tax=Pseudogemmobacter lacusdianii TaxID=3069608 RepID=A0ABU0VWB3_9RHOB|nr:imidazolonepropionase [Xinfangfangia sp. CPCC 101601]MDQ2066027.1 imidazolonepropionase [Xinfangfangia sp. CPCC 101601]
MTATLWTNARIVTADGTTTPSAPGALELLTDGGKIVALGADLPRQGAKIVDCEGRLMTPAPIDCHTHLVFGGDRAFEFEQRLDGVAYEEIARAGGGIKASMRATRAMDVDQLVTASLPRLDHLLAEGVSTVEIKSGYGLSVEAELHMLRAARAMETQRNVRIRKTWLAAHALPPEYAGRAVDYIHEVAIAGLNAGHAEGLIDAVDSFCEGIAFSTEELAPLYARAKALGLDVKIHSEQLSHAGGTAFAARHGALSADHLEYATAEDAALMAASGTVAVLLPGAFYTLRETVLPPVEAFRAAGVPMALSTDCNPGTSPLTSILMTMNMGATLFRLTVSECLKAVTCNAAQALGLSNETGRIAPGLSADLALWDVESPAQLVARIGFNPLHSRVFRGAECPQ